jgi:hypothetical protein
MPPSKPTVEDLLRRLLLLTSEGKIDWGKTEDAPASYEYVGDSGDRVVIDSRDDDGFPPIDLLVFSADGDLIREFQWSSARSADPSTTDDEALERLYMLAKDRATGAGDVLDRLFNSLPPADEDIPF